MILVRRSRPQPPPACSSLCHPSERCSVSGSSLCDARARFWVGDFVQHEDGRTGQVDTMVCVGAMHRWVYWVSEWNGRGAPPFLYVAQRFPASHRELQAAAVPKPVFVVRRR